MPLSEFLRMARGNLDQDEQNRRPNGLPSRGGNELVELVWENGQIVMQGQSSRVTKAPSTHNLQSHTPRLPDLRIGKFDGVESIFKDMPPMVPSGGLDVTQDDEIIPWLNYPLDDGIPQEYCNDLLPEISGVTESNLHSNGNALKGSSSRARLSSPWLPQQGHISDPSLGSGVSDNTTNIPDAVFANSNSIKMERQHVEGPTSSSNSLNFSHFSRPAALIRANLSSNNGDVNDKTSLVKQINSSEKGTDIRFQSTTGCIEVDRRQPVSKPTKESTPAEQMEGLKRETNVKNQKSPIPSNGVQESEKTVEPVIASSSVGSGNSPDRASCDQMHNSKRKFRENEEFDCHSDDIGTESVSVKKASSARGGAGSKRSRAAEVHNLSERKRRDRINEKMRALQELIPNCNKADKASMLDEAIEYLKTLQLQVQIMSMGAGLCMPHMMFPTGMQHIHPAHMPHFSPMGVGLGMGMGMGYGMGMLDMNGGAPGCPIFPIPPMHGPHFPSPMMGPTNFQRIPGPTQHVFGHPAHGLPGQPPLVPLPNRPPIGSGRFAMGVNTSTSGGQVNVPNTSVTTNSEDPMRNESSQLMQNAEVTADVLRQPAEVQENKQGTDVSASADGTPTTNATDVSRKDGCE